MILAKYLNKNLRIKRSIANVAQPGTAQISVKESVSLESLSKKVPHSLFPQGYPGSNPGVGVFIYGEKNTHHRPGIL